MPSDFTGAKASYRHYSTGDIEGPLRHGHVDLNVHFSTYYTFTRFKFEASICNDRGH